MSRNKAFAALSESEPAAQKFPWLVRPADAVPLADVEAIREAANEYFEFCAANGIKPRLMGLSLALGVEGPVSLQRMAMRRPELRYIISRCLSAVAYGYEEELESGAAAGPIFMLKHLPEFDTQEPIGSRPIQYFSERKEIQVNAKVAGVRTIDHEGSELTPEQAYFQLIHGQADIEDAVYEDVKPAAEVSAQSLMELLAEDEDDHKPSED